MRIKRISKILATTALAIAVAACSTTKSPKGSGSDSNYMGGGSNGVSTQGLGSDSQYGDNIGGYCITDACRLHAPSNQIYFFDFDRSDLHDKYGASINAQANYIVGHGSAHVLLTGNTDERGSREYNIALGNRRAVSVANQLKAQGVKPNQVRVVSYGAEKPLVQGHDERSWAINRNVQLIYEAK